MSLNKKFTCFSCKKTFGENGDWTEEERQAEFDKNFGRKYEDEELVLTCDKCYQKIINNALYSDGIHENRNFGLKALLTDEQLEAINSSKDEEEF